MFKSKFECLVEVQFFYNYMDCSMKDTFFFRKLNYVGTKSVRAE